MLTYYLKIVATVIVFAVGYGFAVPTAVSTPDNLVVLAGFGIAFLVPVIIYSMWSEEIATIIKAVIGNTETPVEATSTKKKSSSNRARA